jgi:hypothetical protein
MTAKEPNVTMTHDAPDVVESTAVEVYAPAAAPSTLFRTDDPVEVLERASRVAGALKDALKQQGMVQTIQGREHVKVEGWTTCGAMLGVVPVVMWSRPLDGEQGWEARVEARTLDGRVVGAAEATCSRHEKTWKSRDDYALRSMAQTRATSKALRGPLGFIVTLAGYEATPSEEMPAGAAHEAQAPPVASPAQTQGLLSEARATGIDFADLLRLICSTVGWQIPAEITDDIAPSWVDSALNALSPADVPKVSAAIKAAAA